MGAIVSTGGEWTDRFLATLGGAAGLMAVSYYQAGDIFGGNVGVTLMCAAVWLSAPSSQRRRSLRQVLTDHERERFVMELSAVYGVNPGDPVLSQRPVGSWDPFGTPVIWCQKGPEHDAHLWPINGPQCAPVLCVGHPCVDPDVHLGVKS